MEEDETQQRLKNLQAMIRNVYMPLMESKVETRLHMEKFQKQINISLQQAYGNVTIRVPPVPANKDDDEIRKDRATIEEFKTAIVISSTSCLCRMNGRRRSRRLSTRRRSESRRLTRPTARPSTGVHALPPSTPCSSSSPCPKSSASSTYYPMPLFL
jgi:hypothetical protein